MKCYTLILFVPVDQGKWMCGVGKLCVGDWCLPLDMIMMNDVYVCAYNILTNNNL